MIIHLSIMSRWAMGLRGQVSRGLMYYVRVLRLRDDRSLSGGCIKELPNLESKVLSARELAHKAKFRASLIPRKKSAINSVSQARHRERNSEPGKAALPKQGPKGARGVVRLFI